MRIGAIFPQLEIGADAVVIRDYAQSVEGLGYDHILVYDHVLGAHVDRFEGRFRPPYTHQSTFHEPFVLFGYLAAITTRVELATGIIILPQRQTALVAKQAAEVDVLSGGRLRLGVGIGWNHVEYEALGEQFGNRGRRVEEQIALLRRLWTEELVDFDGKYHSVQQAGINPLPIQRPIPIWMGGSADAAMRRIAKVADGWYPQQQAGPNGREAVDRMRSYVAEAGRDPNTFGIEGRIGLLTTTPEEKWGEALQWWRDIGATHISLNTIGAGLASPKDHIETLRRFRQVAG
ncbi:MAG: LLM class F420-dependent oxidoreductase [Chloroflexi bacterium]|nr:LLM class F420-dependent oxidoreductase [Chloroflexota bacterium]